MSRSTESRTSHVIPVSKAPGAGFIEWTPGPSRAIDQGAGSQELYAAGSHAGPTPVLLIHGWNDHARSFHVIREHLLETGWRTRDVLCLDFADTWGSNVDHAAEIDAAVRRLRERTGASLVDIVAHSMGGLATRWYIAFAEQPAPVRSVIFIATPHRGTWFSLLAWGNGAVELRPGSEFLRTLSSRPFPDRIRTYTIRTRLETHVIPGSSAAWPGSIEDRLITLSPHAFMLRSRSVARQIGRWLTDPAGDRAADSVR